MLEDFPETIADEADTPLDCRIPPRHDPDAPHAVDEARGLRAAYERQLAASGRTNVGQIIAPAGVPDALAALLALTEGTPLEESGLPADLRLLGLDIRAYYEEAAIALAGHVPAARQAASWLFARTEAGMLLKRAQAALRQAGAPCATRFYLVPSTQQNE